MPADLPTRDQLGEEYLAQLPFTPYPMQEEALLAWFTAKQGVLVTAPTGTGKTLIAQAALYEALRTGKTAYYTTPLIALTEQKMYEMQESAIRWGFRREDVGLVTGNRRVNPDAKVLVVVAEILLNRLLNPSSFRFEDVCAVVMDEFHSFADPERGIVWELSLAMLPAHVRLLLLSATVGNALEFTNWLERSHQRKLDLVQSTERKVPLTYQWIPDEFLTDHVQAMTKGTPEARMTPALVFCFNRDDCWAIAEQLKGLSLLDDQQRALLHEEVNRLAWTQGMGPKFKQMLHRGVGVHHAGVLPKYRRVVEMLFERKLLAVVLCTETLAAGINLPARSVVLSALVKGPFGKEKLVDPSTAQQIFGRAGRPQFDDRGYVFAIAHEDDVRILRWKAKFDQIPENTKDPGLIKAKKALKKKKPSRRDGVQYWSEGQFKQLQGAPPAKLYSKGPLPWRLLAYLLMHSPEVARIRLVVRKRLMDDARLLASDKVLDRMLLLLHKLGYVTLDPPPPAEKVAEPPKAPTETKVVPEPKPTTEAKPEIPAYVPVLATPTAELAKLLVFRSIHPLYATFLLKHLGLADANERIQMIEGVLGLPGPVLRHLRVPFPEDLPPGPFTLTRLDPELIQRGLIAAPRAPHADGEEGEEGGDDDFFDERRERPPTLSEKLALYFEALHPEVTDVTIQSVWCVGELLRLAGDFNKFVQSRDLVKQEGILFRHLLRLILLCEEFAQVTPADTTPEEWQSYLRELTDKLTISCRAIDPTSTDEMIQSAHAADLVVAKEPSANAPEGERTSETSQV